jgi:hypothetical protein
MAPGAAMPRPNAHVLPLLHPLCDSLTAPPVGPDRARSPTDRTAPQLGGAMGAVFACKANRGNSPPGRPSQLRRYGFRGERNRPGPTGGAVRDDSGSAVGLTNTQHDLASAWPARLPSSNGSVDGSRQTRITVSPPIDRLLLAKMSETNFRSCAAICRDFRVSARFCH